MAAAEKCSCIFGMSAIHGRQKRAPPLERRRHLREEGPLAQAFVQR
jgi:hypothetical protein